MIEEHRHCADCGKIVYWNIEEESFSKLCENCSDSRFKIHTELLKSNMFKETEKKND